MRIDSGHVSKRNDECGFDQVARREARAADRDKDRSSRRAERIEARQAERADRKARREADRAERREQREAMRPSPRTMPVEPDGGIGDGAGPIPGGPMPVEPDGGIGDGAGPIPFPPEATTLAIGEEDGGGGPFPIDPDGPFPIGGKPIPVEPDGGIGDGAGPIPFPPEATTLALGEEDGGGPFPVEPDGGIGDGAGPIPLPPIGGPAPVPGRVPPPDASGSYRLGANSIGANFLNFDGAGGAEIIGAGGTSLNFERIRIGEDGSIFGEKGSGNIGRRPTQGGVGFKLSIAPNDAGYLLQVKAYGEKFDIQAGPNGINPNPVDPPAPTDPSGPPTRGGGLLFLYSLGENDIGATNVTLNTGGTGTITGPGVELMLSGGGYDESGDWVATSGGGTIDGEPAMLKRNADGNVFVASGEGGLADRVTAWISGGRELDAEVVAVAQP